MKLRHLSHTMIDTALEKCGQAFAYRYLERRQAPVGTAAVRGRIVDRAVMDLFRARLEGRSEVGFEQLRQSTLDAAADELGAGDYVVDGDYEGQSLLEARQRIARDAETMVLHYARHVAPTIEPTALQLRVEVPASEALPIPIVGVLDVLARERDDGDGRDEAVRDLKTKTKAPQATLADRSHQLTMYELLYRALRGRGAKVLALDVVWLTPATKKVNHKVLETTRDTRDLEVLVARANAVVQMAEREVFSPAPSEHWYCSAKWCQYTAECPFFSRRDRPAS